MRPHFVVEVLDEQNSTTSPAPAPTTSAPTAPSVHQGRRIRVETVSEPSIPVQNTEPKPPELPPQREQVISSQRNAHPNDPFTEREERVKQLFQEFQLADSQRENPVIDPPARPKRLRKEGERTPSSEHAFRQRLERHQPLEKIESFYRKQQGGGSPPPRSKSFWNNFSLEPWKFWKTWKYWSRKPLIPSGRWGRVGLGISLGAILLLVTTGTAIAVVRADLQDATHQADLLMDDLRNAQFTSARERLTQLEKKHSRYQWLYSTTRPMMKVALGEEKSQYLDKLLVITDHGLQGVEAGLDASDALTLAYLQFMGKEQGKTVETVQQVTGQLEVLFTNLSDIQAEVATLDNPFGWETVQNAKQQTRITLPEVRRGLLAAQQITYVLPDLLGENGKKQYLVLLQNNEELRPTGGFIGSFGILTVEKGRFVDFRVEDVYEADGQLNGYVEPPPELVEHLGEAQWWLRDVNWSPDFPTVAEQAGWFIDKELNIKPDGVIGINLFVAQKLLGVTGPIELVDYDEIVTQENLYQQAEMHSEINFFPGSSQKRDFLSAVADQLFLAMMKEETNKVGLIKAFFESAEESQLLVALQHPQAQEAFARLGWDGSVKTPDCPQVLGSDDCFVDTVMQVEANLGVNKANQYIERMIDHRTVVTTEKATHLRKVHVENHARSNAWPEGAYKAYFRLFIPDTAQLHQVTINGAVLEAQKIRETSEAGKKGIGFLVNVPVSESADVQVEYSVPIAANQSQVYALFEQKQSGTADSPTTHTLEFPGRRVLTVAPEPVSMNGSVKFESDRQRHQFMAVELE